eukprot:5343682-Alexandrium_andersonii.AAC.1
MIHKWKAGKFVGYFKNTYFTWDGVTDGGAYSATWFLWDCSVEAAMVGPEERARSRSVRGRSASGPDFRRFSTYTWRIGDGYC